MARATGRGGGAGRAFRALAAALGGIALAVPWAAPPAASQEGAGPAIVEAAREAGPLRVEVEGLSWRESYLGEAAPVGEAFLLVTGSLANAEATNALTLPEAARSIVIHHPEGYGRLHPLSAETPAPLWGETALAAGEVRPFEALFVLPEGVRERLSFVIAGTSLGTVAIPLGEHPAVEPLAGPAGLAEAELSVLAVRELEDVGGTRPPEGWRLLAVRVAVAGRDPVKPLRTAVADDAALVEDGRYVYRVAALGERLSPHFARPFTLLPGLPLEGDLVFVVPEATGALALAYATGSGILRLPFAGKAPAPDTPVATAGNGSLSVSLYGARRATAPDGGAGGAVVVDLALTLLVDDPRATAALRPRGQVWLVDEDGARLDLDAEAWRAADHPLLPGELRPGLTSRGRMAFAVPPEKAIETLSLHVAVVGEAIEVPLAAGPEAAPAEAEAEAPAPALPALAEKEGNVVVRDPAKGIELAIARPSFEPGWEIFLSFRLPPLPEVAWIGVVPSDVPHVDEAVNDEHDLAWQYVDGRREGLMRFLAPETPGRYDLRVNADNEGGAEIAYLTFEVAPAPVRRAPALPDLAPGEPVNVAPTPFGTRGSGGYSDSAPAMLDGDIAGYSEGGYGPMGEESPLTAIFERAYAIERVRIVYPQPTGDYYKYRLEATEDGESWFVLSDRTDRPYRSVQEHAFAPRRLKGLRIIPVEHTVPGHFTVRELEAYTRDPVPLGGTPVVVHHTDFRQRRDLAYRDHGGRIVEASSEQVAPFTAERLIDGNVDAPGWIAGTGLSPQHVTIAFNQDRATTIDGVAVRPLSEGYGHRAPKVAVVNVRRPGGEWAEIGRYGLFQAAAWQLVSFDPVEADRVRLDLYGSYHDEKAMGLGAVAVLEAVDDWRDSILPFYRPDFAAGYNIARDVLGGRAEWATDTDGDMTPARLIDGGVHDWGWSSVDAEMPKEIVFSFKDRRSALIAGIAVHPWGGFNSFRPYENAAREIEVLVSDSGPTSGFEAVGRFLVDLNFVTQLFAFEPTRARYVMLRILSNHGGGKVTLGEVEVLEAVRPGYDSILADQEVNLLDARLGGHMVIQTGSGRDGPFDGGTETEGWHSYAEAQPPIDLVLGFHQHRRARIDRIVVNPESAYPQDWVRRFKLFASDDGPVDGYRLLGDFEVAPEPRDQTFTFPETTARFLKLRILENQGGGRYSLGEVRVPEAQRPGAGMLLSRGFDEERYEVEDPAAAAPLAAAHESEPNDDRQRATPLPLGTAMEGVIDPPDDVDVYRLDTRAAPLPGLNVVVEEPPALHVGLELLDAEGEVVDQRPLYEESGEAARFTWHVPQGVYDLRVYRPLSSIVVLSDLSGSTDAVRGDITHALHAFVDQTTRFEHVSMVGFCHKLIVAAEFSQEREALRDGVYQLYAGCNGTALYDAMREASDWLNAREGLRAIVIVTDGEDSGNSAEELDGVWSRLLGSPVRVYAVGYGEGLDSPLGGVTGRQLLRSWADASGGRYYEAPSGQVIDRVARHIGHELRRPSRYRITATTPAGEGDLRVVEIGESIAGVSAPSRIALILDASGSMRGRIEGETRKMDVAKRVMRALIAGLPGQTEVGLRVYGHREPREPKALSCADTEMVVPFGALDRGRLTAAVEAIEPKGQTPIGLSLAELRNDFGDAPGKKMVILVTDGIETCDPDPEDANYPPAVVRALLGEGLEIKVNVIGFDIAEGETRAFLRRIAKTGGGQYFDAAGAAELASALEEAIRAGFQVSDSRGARVAESRVGEPPVRVPEGRYRVALAVDPALAIEDVAVEAERETRVLLDKEGTKVGVERRVVAPGTPLPAGARQPPPRPPAPAVAALAPIETPPAGEGAAPAAPATPAAPAAPAPPATREARLAALIEEGDALLADRKLTKPPGESALDRFREALALDPGNEEARAGIERIADTYAGWARVNLGRGEPGKAAAYAERALSVRDDRADLHVLHGDALLDAGKADEAEAAYRAALALAPGEPQAEAGLAEAARLRADRAAAGETARPKEAAAGPPPASPPPAAEPSLVDELAARLAAPRAAPPAPEPTAPAPPSGTDTVRGVPVVLDTATLVFGDRIVALEGVIGALGGHEKSLAAYIGGREVACAPAGGRYRCTVGEIDLSEAVLFNGGGRATADARPELKAAEAAAKAERRGIWR